MAPKMWLYTLCTGEHTCGARFASLLSISFTKTRLLSLSNIPEWTQSKRDCLGAVLLWGVVLLLVFSLPKCPHSGPEAVSEMECSRVLGQGGRAFKSLKTACRRDYSPLPEAAISNGT